MKKLIIVLALVTFVSTGAFAQGLGFGLTVNQYYSEDANGNLPSVGDAWKNFLEEGEGLYWGGFFELMGRHYALGLSFNAQVYPDELESAFDTWEYDVNLYLAYHLLGTKAFFDPFLQAGFGMVAFDWMNKDKMEELGWTVTEDPLAGSAYFNLGGGIGLNFGSLGIFARGMYNFQSKEPLVSGDAPDGWEYEIPAWYIHRMTWTFGAKILL